MYHIKEMIKATIDDLVHQVPILPGETILDTLINFNTGVPYSCRSGHCYVCRCKLISGEVESKDDSILTASEKSQRFILACQSYAKTDIEVSFD